MAGSVNKVILVGNLGADPEVRSFQSGGRVCNLRIATGEQWTDRQTGERRERTEWHTVVIRSADNNGGLVGVAERYLRKGSKVYIEGKLQTRKWQDNAGQDRWTTEVVVSGPGTSLTLLGDPAGNGGTGGRGGGSAAGSGAGQSYSGTSGGGGFDDGLEDDEIPF